MESTTDQLRLELKTRLYATNQLSLAQVDEITKIVSEFLQIDKVKRASWDLVVRGQDRKWKSGKGMEFKVTLKPINKEGAQAELKISSCNPVLFQAYPQDQVFTVVAKDSGQQQLPEEEDED